MPSIRWVYPGLLWFTRTRRGVFGFILVCVCSLGRTLWSSDSFGFAWFHLAATRDRRVHLCTRWFTTAREVASGSFEISCVHSCPSRCRRVHSVPRWFTRARLGVVGFSRVQSGSRVFSLANLVIFGFIQVHIGSLRRALGSQGSYRFPWIQQCALSGRRVQSKFRVFTRAHPDVVVFIQFRVGSLGRA